MDTCIVMECEEAKLNSLFLEESDVLAVILEFLSDDVEDVIRLLMVAKAVRSQEVVVRWFSQQCNIMSRGLDTLRASRPMCEQMEESMKMFVENADATKRLCTQHGLIVTDVMSEVQLALLEECNRRLLELSIHDGMFSCAFDLIQKMRFVERRLWIALLEQTLFRAEIASDPTCTDLLQWR